MPDSTPSLSNQFQAILGERIKAQRSKKRLTQVQLSELVGVSRPALANIETGKQRVSVFLLARLAEQLEILPGDLIPKLAEAEAKTTQERQISIGAHGKPELLTRELKNLNISLESEGRLESALAEVKSQHKKPLSIKKESLK